jgi:hypothetical protein
MVCRCVAMLALARACRKSSAAAGLTICGVMIHVSRWPLSTLRQQQQQWQQQPLERTYLADNTAPKHTHLHTTRVTAVLLATWNWGQVLDPVRQQKREASLVQVDAAGTD